MKKIMLMAMASILLSGCLDKMETIAPNDEGFEWVTPISSQRFLESDLEEGATEIKLKYNQGLSYTPDIDFNSQDVVDCFTFEDEQATADLSCFSEFYKQGDNRLQVQGSDFGTSVNFEIVSKGPNIAIRDVCFNDSPKCDVLPTEGTVDVLVEYRDASNITNTTLNGVDPYESQGNMRRYLVNTSETYEFVSENQYGLQSQIVYKAEGLYIEEIVDVRVDEEIIFNIKDIIAVGISNLVASGDLLEGLSNLEGPLNTRIRIDYLETGIGTIEDIYITDDFGNDADLAIKIKFEPEGEYIDSNNDIIDFDDVGLRVDLNIKLPWYLLFGINFDISMWVERVEVNSEVDVSIDSNSKIKLNLGDIQGSDVLSLYDVKSGDDNGIDIIGWLVQQPFLRGIILDIVQGVINRNLEEIVIGTTFEPDTNPPTEVEVLFEPVDLVVSNFSPDNIGNVFVGLKGFIKTNVAHPEVKPALGSFYVDDTNGLPEIPDDGSSLALSLNSNAVNQGLLSAYSSGITHITVMNGEVFLGPDATDELGSEGDFRVELYPSSAGQFSVEGDSIDKGYLEYNGAELTVWLKDEGIWKRLFLVDVDIRAGVILEVRESKLYMTIAETPTFVIRDITNLKASRKFKLPFGTINVAISISAEIIEDLISDAITFGIPQVAESELEIDISRLNLPRRLSTESLSTDEGHLQFELDVGE